VPDLTLPHPDWVGRRLREALSAVGRRYARLFFVAYGFSILIYSYLFTTPLFTNHTLPNVWVGRYPGFTTLVEGRWFSDILFQLTGGSGVQPVQMAIAAALQIVNAFLLAALLGIRKQSHRLILALFLAAHPAFLDYYSYVLGDISFVAGDTLALLGVLALDRIRSRIAGALLAILCLVLSLATYQPKIALIGILLLIWCLLGLTRTTAEPAQPGNASPRGLVRVVLGLIVAVTAAAIYSASALLIVAVGTGERTHLNAIGVLLHEALVAYPETYANFTSRVQYLPPWLTFLPLLVAAIGAAALLLRTPRRYWPLSLLLILLLPPALQASYLVNDQTWHFSGRILSADAYLLACLLALGWSVVPLRAVVTVAAWLMIYFFSLLATQAVNAAAMVTIFDLGKINRIVARMESVVPDLYDRPRAVVIVGDLTFASRQQFTGYSRFPYGAGLDTEAFANYRQVEILNFFLGREILMRPSNVEVSAVLSGAAGHRPWPAPESVYVQDGAMVVLLRPYAPDVSVTWPR
jgi:hypothetical protein